MSLKLSGLTLFKTFSGWQLSLRPEGEPGFTVEFISDQDARKLLDLNFLAKFTKAPVELTDITPVKPQFSSPRLLITDLSPEDLGI